MKQAKHKHRRAVKLARSRARLFRAARTLAACLNTTPQEILALSGLPEHLVRTAAL